MSSFRPFGVPGTSSGSPIRLHETAAFRLAVIYTLIFTAALTAFAGVSYWLTSLNLEQQINLRLQDQMDDLESDYPEFVASPKRFTEATSRYWYWIRLADGRDIGTKLPLKIDEGRFQHFKIADTLNPTRKPDGTGRALVRKLPNGVTLAVGDDISNEDELLENLFACLYVLPLLCLLLGVGYGFIASMASLKRLRRIISAADAIRNGDLTRRIENGQTRNEMDRLAITLNAMLDRIGNLMDSLQQVSNDIAHDLRTPLTHLRHKLELLQAGKLDTNADLLEDVDRLLTTFSALLRLAQIDAGTRREMFAPVDMTRLLQELTAAYLPLWEERAQHVTMDLAATLPLYGDRQLLQQIVSNLFENTLQHLPAGCAVHIALTATDGILDLTVADNGSGVPAEFRQRVLERFYRLDKSRGTPGSGLGLSLVASIVKLHHGRLQLEDAGPGLRARVSLPLKN